MMSRTSWGWTPFEGPPSPSEIASPEAVKRQTTDPRPKLAEVDEIDQSIAKLESELSELRMKRIKVLSDNALINLVPPEVLSHIFELGVHRTNKLVHILSLVSKHWRSIALQTPSLWSYIRLDNDWEHDGARFLRKIRTYMERSQAAKILVDLDFRHCESKADAESFLNALKPHLSRCYSFRINASGWSWIEIAARYTDTMQDSLEEVALGVDPEEETTAPVPLLTGDFNRLTSVTLEQTPMATIFLKARLPNLKHLNLIQFRHSSYRSRIPLHEYLETLTTQDAQVESAFLQSIRFHLDGSESIFQHPQDALSTRVPYLTHLAISYVDATNICIFLDAVDLPSLVRIAVQMASGSESNNLSWLEHLASASSNGRLPALRHLEMCTCATEDAVISQIVGAFHRLPQLTALGISSPPSGSVGPRFFDALAAFPRGCGAWLLPRLQTLSLVRCDDVSGFEVLRILNSRRLSVTGSVARIRTVRLVTVEPLEQDIVDELKEGLEELVLT